MLKLIALLMAIFVACISYALANEDMPVLEGFTVLSTNEAGVRIFRKFCPKSARETDTGYIEGVPYPNLTFCEDKNRDLIGYLKGPNPVLRNEYLEGYDLMALGALPQQASASPDGNPEYSDIQGRLPGFLAINIVAGNTEDEQNAWLDGYCTDETFSASGQWRGGTSKTCSVQVGTEPEVFVYWDANDKPWVLEGWESFVPQAIDQ